MEARWSIGIDLGGTKIEAWLLADSEPIERRRIQTPGSYETVLDAVASLVEDLDRRAGRSVNVGIGIPGALSPATGLVKNANSVWLNGRPFRTDLERRLRRPVRVANDANCFAMSEATDGAAAGAAVVFGVIVGTGTGAGIVVHGQVLTGPNGLAGEWGHTPLPWAGSDECPGPFCYCGKTGCVETFLSGPALTRDHERRAGAVVTPPDLVRRAAAGDAAAEASLRRYEHRMARALAAVINTLDPDVIVLGGGLSNIGRLYRNVPAVWGEYVFAAGSAEYVRTRLVPARHGDASGVRGAAWLWR